jgi:hypothetical protein
MRRGLGRTLRHLRLPSIRKAKGNYTPESNEPSAEVAHGPHEHDGPSDKSEPNHSIWGTRLREGQIRLFNIELDESDEIRGTLEVFEHKSAPQYIAQSYVCGEGACDIRITVNGNAHCIKPNLFIALRQTKNALQQGKSGTHWGFPWTQTTWLWIDAISIHQSDVPELEMQIQFMEQIYRGASSTLVSLGNWAESHKLISICCLNTMRWRMSRVVTWGLLNLRGNTSHGVDQVRIRRHTFR